LTVRNVDLSVIVTTYDQPRWLELTLTGLATQSYQDFQVVVADDGSGPETRGVVERARGNLGLSLVHVWHSDAGFRKSVILNRAIRAAGGEYLLFTDGDCIPRADLVEVHVREAEEGRFLSGGYLKLSAEVSGEVKPHHVLSGEVFRPSWLRARGWRGGRRSLRLTRRRRLAAWLDTVTPTAPTWNGHNASAWREAVEGVNGFDMEMGYWGLDRALGERMENLGVRGKQIRHRAPCLHLHHSQPYRDDAVAAQNKEIRKRIRREGETRATKGRAELPPDPHLCIRGPEEDESSLVGEG
jgi:glycosyltransferase involved in cell wall biosynthesis